MAEDIAVPTRLYTTTLPCSLGVLLVSVCCDIAQALSSAAPVNSYSLFLQSCSNVNMACDKKSE